jgi:fatty acid desaturase
MELRPIASYASAVRPHVPASAFAPAHGRLWWLPVHASIIAALAYVIATARIPPALWPIASIVIGLSMAFVAFLGHEVLHGAVIRGRLAIHAVGWLCLLPFTVSPTLWTNWHNRVHHNHCAQVGRDPDMYPTLAEYESQFAMRIMADYFGLGARRWRSVISLVFGFTGQSQQMLWQARMLRILTPRQYVRAIVEFLLGAAVWIAIAIAIGGTAFVFVYVIPMLVANVIVMCFILTNHSLSSLTLDINDPLVNSLSVTLPRPLEWLTLHFGYHVEHHVFPAMSARHHGTVRAVLRAQFPRHYQSMPLTRALGQLYATGRVYRDNTTLIEPRSGRIAPALQPRAGS